MALVIGTPVFVICSLRVVKMLSLQIYNICKSRIANFVFGAICRFGIFVISLCLKCVEQL